jgi:hypothetical protein
MYLPDPLHPCSGFYRIFADFTTCAIDRVALLAGRGSHRYNVPDSRAGHAAGHFLEKQDVSINIIPGHRMRNRP